MSPFLSYSFHSQLSDSLRGLLRLRLEPHTIPALRALVAVNFWFGFGPHYSPTSISHPLDFKPRSSPAPTSLPAVPLLQLELAPLLYDTSLRSIFHVLQLASLLPSAFRQPTTNPDTPTPTGPTTGRTLRRL